MKIVLQKLKSNMLDSKELLVRGIFLRNATLSSNDYLEEEINRDFEIELPLASMSVVKKYQKYDLPVK